MFNATDTMNSVRWLLNKYRWMASENDSELPRNQKDRAFRPGLNDAEKKKILELYLRGLSVYQVAEETGRSATAVRKLLADLGKYKGTQHTRKKKYDVRKR